MAENESREMKAFSESINKQFHNDKIACIDMWGDYLQKEKAISDSVKAMENQRKAEKKRLDEIASGMVDTSVEIEKAFSSNSKAMAAFLDHINAQIEYDNNKNKWFIDSLDKLSDTDKSTYIDNLKSLIEIEKPKLAAAETAKEKAVESGKTEDINAADDALKEVNDRISFYRGQLEKIQNE